MFLDKDTENKIAHSRVNNRLHVLEKGGLPTGDHTSNAISPALLRFLSPPEGWKTYTLSTLQFLTSKEGLIMQKDNDNT